VAALLPFAVVGLSHSGGDHGATYCTFRLPGRADPRFV